MSYILKKTSRRSFIKQAVTAGMLITIPLATNFSFAAEPLRWDWQGRAMGTNINISICHESQKAAEALVSLCVDEISRLESIFTLYSDRSELALLNKNGILEYPSPELLELISLAYKYGDITNGNFDMTLQPIWRIIKQEGIDSLNIKKAIDLVDYKNVYISAEKIAFSKPGMGVSLNGIAQGYITDKITSLLVKRGIHNALVNIGEIRAIGRNEDDEAWKIGIHDPREKEYERYFYEVRLRDKALSTTGGYGLRFNKKGTKHHIFNPKTGKSENYYMSLSVIADTATKADALSTAFYLMKTEEIKKVISGFKDLKVIIMHSDERIEIL